MGRLMQLLSAASAPAAWWPGPGEFALPELAPAEPLKVLLVVAHPDDESECAGTLYRITHELGGVVDQVIVTNGEGGRHFSAPALEYYGISRSEEISKELPRLRRKEVVRAGQIIGIRRHYFLGQTDTGFTLDPGEGLRNWDLQRIQRELRSLLRRERYDLVLTLLPAEDTHGHHKAVAVLAVEAVAALPESRRPEVSAVRTGSPVNGRLPRFSELPEFPGTRATSAEPVWSFDRRTPLKQNAALDHSIIVHWVIAEHKSQGMFQMEYGRHTHEYFWQFSTGRAQGQGFWKRLQALSPEERRFTNAEAA
ncbi:MAG: LmbE family protein [Bryobacterales bacterium]|nr:LmbE family protein [Bryobacterales bacterium]